MDFGPLPRPRPPSADEDLKTARERSVCEQVLDDAIANSGFVRFMLGHLERAGCPFRREHFACAPCEQPIAGGLDPSFGIVLCQNHLRTKTAAYDTLTHELIHAYDWCRAKVDYSNCVHHACTEIRAANLSGDCMFTKELDRGHLAVRAHQQACVRRRAELSVRSNPSCADGAMAAEAVAKAFETCFNDTAPFDRIP